MQIPINKANIINVLLKFNSFTNKFLNVIILNITI